MTSAVEAALSVNRNERKSEREEGRLDGSEGEGEEDRGEEGEEDVSETQDIDSLSAHSIRKQMLEIKRGNRRRRRRWRWRRRRRRR